MIAPCGAWYLLRWKGPKGSSAWSLREYLTVAQIKKGDSFMGKELVGRILMVLGTVLAFRVSWWAPLVAAPLIFKIYNVTFCVRDRIYDLSQRLILDIITHTSYLGYLILAIVLFQHNMGKWYLGLITWFVVAHLFGLLWPRRWHYERMEGTL